MYISALRRKVPNPLCNRASQVRKRLETNAISICYSDGSVVKWMQLVDAEFLRSSRERAQASLRPQKEMNSSALFEGTCKWEKKNPHSSPPQPNKTRHTKCTTRVQINTSPKKQSITEKNARHIILLQVFSHSQITAAYHSYKICVSISMNPPVKAFARLIFQVNDSQGTWEKDLCQWYAGSANCQRVLLCN